MASGLSPQKTDRSTMWKWGSPHSTRDQPPTRGGRPSAAKDGVGRCHSGRAVQDIHGPDEDLGLVSRPDHNLFPFDLVQVERPIATDSRHGQPQGSLEADVRVRRRVSFLVSDEAFNDPICRTEQCSFPPDAISEVDLKSPPFRNWT
jgi:hypothetical protein